MGQRPPFLFMKDVMQRTWNLTNPFIIKPYGESSFSFEFSEEDREKVLEVGCFNIASQLFIVRPWQLFVEAELEDMQTIPIWVIFKKFPIELWDEEGFNIVGSTVGNPLFIDKLTEERKRTTYTRIYVEIDTQSKYYETVTVVADKFRAYNLPIEYNWRPQRCSDCETFGHTNARCPKNKKGRSTVVCLMKNEDKNIKESDGVHEHDVEIEEREADGSKQATPIRTYSG